MDSQELLDELPSCLESLVSSCEQLHHLAGDISHHHIRVLLGYGYAQEYKVVPTIMTTDSKQAIAQIALDANTLEAMSSILNLLPYLNQLNTFVEHCFLTMELTLRRCAYHLNNQSSNNSTMQGQQFQLPRETKLDAVFICFMDFIYALTSLDQAIRCHTSLNSNLTLFKVTCQMVLDSQPQQLSQVDEHLAGLPKDKLRKLVEHVSSLQTTLANEKQTLFQQCLSHLQNLELVLNNSNLSQGYKNLCDHFENFLTLYHVSLLLEQDPQAIVNLSNRKRQEMSSFSLIQSHITPTLYMTSVAQKLFGFLSMFVLHCWLFGKTTKNSKTIRSMALQTLQQFKSFSFIPLLGSNSYQIVDEFLTLHLPLSHVIEMKHFKQLQEQRENLLKLDTRLEFERLTLKVTPWLIKFQEQRLAEVKSQRGREQVRLCNQGLGLAHEINYSIKNIMTAHLHFGKAMTESKLIPLLRLVALLKSIQLHLYKDSIVHHFMLHSEQQVLVAWARLLSSIRKRLMSQKLVDSERTFTICTICLESKNLLSERGRQTLSLTLPMLVPLLEKEEIHHLNQLLSALSPSYSFHDQISAATNCDHLFWHLSAFTAYYNHSLEEDPCAFDEVHYFHLALDDITSLFRLERDNTNLLWLEEKVKVFCTQVEEGLVDQFKVDFLDKICQEFEMELRLQTHRDIHLDGHNPFRRHLYNFKRIFVPPSSATFKLFNNHLSLIHYVEQHLNRICYNLTAIAPHDWFTYDQMINLARQKYGLQPANSQLPTQTLDYGLDLLDITRNLGLFVSRYAYDLTNQVFIEKSTNRLSGSAGGGGGVGGGHSPSSVSGLSLTGSNSYYLAANCQLNVVQVSHIAKSIQTHGYGVLNSSVNCSYQVMKKLVAIFSRQMSDEKLRAILAKEQLNLSRHHRSSSSLGSSITFDKANWMVKRFRPIAYATTADPPQKPATTFDLDLMRQSVTHLGNLLAFIRLLKSGALCCASKSVAYVPDLDDLHLLRLTQLANMEFKDLLDEDCGRALLEASENFDQCLADFEENFSAKTNYFGIILGLFANLMSSKTSTITESNSQTSTPTSKTSRREHLKLFYLIVPALTINYVDHLNNCKERVMARSSQARLGAMLSDDGFSMGLAFLLNTLNQTHQFGQLEWFKQVRAKVQEDRRGVESRLDGSQADESLKQTGQMTLRRLAKLELEYESLEYTLSSALLFFRSSAAAAAAADTSAPATSSAGGETAK